MEARTTNAIPLRPDCFSFVLTTEKLVGDLSKAFGSFAREKTEKRSTASESLTTCGFFAFDYLELFSRNSNRIQYDDNSEPRADV